MHPWTRRDSRALTFERSGGGGSMVRGTLSVNLQGRLHRHGPRHQPRVGGGLAEVSPVCSNLRRSTRGNIQFVTQSKMASYKPQNRSDGNYHDDGPLTGRRGDNRFRFRRTSGATCEIQTQIGRARRVVRHARRIGHLHPMLAALQAPRWSSVRMRGWTSSL